MHKVLSLIIILTIGVFGTQAQSIPDQLTLSQDQIDAALATIVDNAEQVESLNADLNNDEVVISVVVIDQDGTSYPVSITLAPTTSQTGSVEWQVTAASLNNYPLFPAQLEAVNAAIQATQPAQVREALEERLILEVTIEDGNITWDLNESFVPGGNIPDDWEPGANVPEDWEPGSNAPGDWEPGANVPEDWEPGSNRPGNRPPRG